MIINPFQFQSFARDASVDLTALSYIGEVTYPPQKAIGNPRSSAGAPGDFRGARFIEVRVENSRGAPDDLMQILDGVKLQMVEESKAIPQGRGKAPGAGCGSNQGKSFERHVDGLGEHSHVDDEIHFVVLHGRIEEFFNVGGKPVDLIDKENLAVL